MSTHAAAAPGPHKANKPAGTLGRFRQDEQGAAAVEFALISVPFVTMLLGLLSVCLYFFTVLENENAVWQGSRDLRTGAFQTGTGAYASNTGDPVQDLINKRDALKQAICNRTRSPSDCMTNMRVLVQARSDFNGIQAPNCKDNTGNLVSNTAARDSIDAGGASSIVLITGCYTWDFGGKLPFFKIGNMPDGSVLVQSSFPLRVEPYN